ncbi:MAG: hypothetical protein D3904_17915 [Candidatus Electrothrix sp. EH2]|nr:hypothetical protein [Candidatus Electrothrix sp. EH2]
MKKISVNFGLVVSLAAFSGINYAQAENIKLPLPATDPGINAVVENIRGNVGPTPDVVKEIMLQMRDSVKVRQAKILPLMSIFRNTIGNEVSSRVMTATRTATMNAQMNAMQDPVSPLAVPSFIAPKFNFE